MSNLRLLSRGPAQRAATEFKNTINGVAADVREMSATLDELGARENKSSEPAPGAEVGSAALAPPHQQNALSAPASQGSAAQQSPPTVASLALPQIPDLRPQLEAVRDALIRNQQTTLSLLQSIRMLLDAHAAELSELKQQIRGQQTVMSNQRRF